MSSWFGESNVTLCFFEVRSNRKRFAALWTQFNDLINLLNTKQLSSDSLMSRLRSLFAPWRFEAVVSLPERWIRWRRQWRVTAVLFDSFSQCHNFGLQYLDLSNLGMNSFNLLVASGQSFSQPENLLLLSLELGGQARNLIAIFALLPVELLNLGRKSWCLCNLLLISASAKRERVSFVRERNKPHLHDERSVQPIKLFDAKRSPHAGERIILKLESIQVIF